MSFDSKLDDILDGEAERRARDNFYDILVCDWDEKDINKTLNMLRDKGSSCEAELMIVYLFARLVEEGRVNLASLVFDGGGHIVSETNFNNYFDAEGYIVSIGGDNDEILNIKYSEDNNEL